MEPLDTGRGRRSVLAAIASGSVAAFAGCIGNDVAEEASTTDGGDDRPSFPAHPGDAPVDPPEGRRCDGPCGMEPAGLPGGERAARPRRR